MHYTGYKYGWFSFYSLYNSKSFYLLNILPAAGKGFPACFIHTRFIRYHFVMKVLV